MTLGGRIGILAALGVGGMATWQAVGVWQTAQSRRAVLSRDLQVSQPEQREKKLEDLGDAMARILAASGAAKSKVDSAVARSPASISHEASDRDLVNVKGTVAPLPLDRVFARMRPDLAVREVQSRLRDLAPGDFNARTELLSSARVSGVIPSEEMREIVVQEMIASAEAFADERNSPTAGSIGFGGYQMSGLRFLIELSASPASAKQAFKKVLGPSLPAPLQREMLRYFSLSQPPQADLAFD